MESDDQRRLARSALSALWDVDCGQDLIEYTLLMAFIALASAAASLMFADSPRDKVVGTILLVAAATAGSLYAIRSSKRRARDESGSLPLPLRVLTAFILLASAALLYMFADPLLKKFIGRAFGIAAIAAGSLYALRSLRRRAKRARDESVDLSLRHLREKAQAPNMAALHLRTIEVLAMAIDAKDQTTPDHLQRLRVYATQIARELSLSEPEMEALQAATMLHDIGKLAVPEHILSKPGKLTPEEFEKMKIHPVVGAKILERVQFPYPVADIVRSHHEKWNGTGYPEGLRGEDIPIGARIIATVDCFDALASERPYRRALPVDEAMDLIVQNAGTAFDPKIVAILQRRYKDLEAIVLRDSVQAGGPPNFLPVLRGQQPRGLAETQAEPSNDDESGFLTSIAAARQEAQVLLELFDDLASQSPGQGTPLSAFAARLKTKIHYDLLCIYRNRENILIPDYLAGSEQKLFVPLRIPLGQGVAGWVAENSRPVVNANPAVEFGYMNDATKITSLNSTVAVPLEQNSRVIGVLSLYSHKKDAFNHDHLRILLAVGPRLATALDNSDSEQLVRIRNGVEGWNRWREENPDVAISLCRSDLRGASLVGVNLRTADLSEANLKEADLSGADLSDANLMSARLQSAVLDRATLTGTKLWGTQREGWSIKGVICERAYLDQAATEVTIYGSREFERLNAEQPRIELFYQDGITTFEVNTLPAMLHHLASLHPGCTIRLKSIEETGGGAKVSITVEDAPAGTFQQIKAEALRSHAAQIALRDDKIATLEIQNRIYEIQNRLYEDKIIPRLLEAVGHHVNIAGSATGIVIASGNASVHAQQFNSLQEVHTVLDEVISRRAELGLAEAEEGRLEKAIRDVQDEIRKGRPSHPIISSGLKTVHDFVVGALGNAVGTALATNAWQPLLDQLGRVMTYFK